jgi:hypothetical protein
MRNTDSRAWDALESWSSTAFLIAGGLLLLFVLLTGLGAFTNVLGEGAVVGAAVVGSGLFGLILAVIGLLGLYPRLSGAAPRLSRGGLGSLGVALTGIFVVIGTLAVVGPPEAPGDVPSFVPPIFISSGMLIMLGYVLFAVASIRTNTPSRRVGLLLAVPGIVLIWHYIALAVFGSQHVFEIIDYTVISMTFLTIGVLLRTEGFSVTRTEPTPDSTP